MRRAAEGENGRRPSGSLRDREQAACIGNQSISCEKEELLFAPRRDFWKRTEEVTLADISPDWHESPGAAFFFV